MELRDADPQICKPSCTDFTCLVVMRNRWVHIFLPPLPEDQAFQSLDLSLNRRSLTHPAHLCCCWAQGPILGTLVGIYSATRQQGPHVATPKAVIKSLLWVLWAGACLPESCLSPARSPGLCTHLQAPFSPSPLLLLLATLTQATPPLAASSSLGTSAPSDLSVCQC